MRMIRSAMLLTCGVALLSCDDSTAPDPTRADSGAIVRVPLNPSSAAGGIIESVTGRAALSPPAGSGTIVEEIRFTALRHGDGTVSGEFERRSQFQHAAASVLTVVQHGPVTCFTILENRAVIGGVIEHGQVNSPEFPGPLPAVEGQSLNWDVADNGEGANDPPDEYGGAFSPGSPPAEQTQCERGPTQTTLPVEEGNIQIHPAPQP